MLNDKTVLITGGTGSFGNKFVETILRDYPDVMNIEQVSQILGVSTSTGYKLIRDGQLCCLKVGRTYRIPKVHLLEYLCVGSRAQQQAV